MLFRIFVVLSLLIINILCYFPLSTERSGKFWWIGFVKFENGVCNSTSNLEGTCYTRRQCRNIPGIESGRCASNIGVCCIIQRTCGDTSQYNNTYFVNTNFPNGVTGATRCTMTIQRCNSDICQIRIDFLSFNLAQPNGDGSCIYDSMIITGGGSQVPVLCGENSGQHVYVDFDNNNDIIITIATSTGATLSRNWNLKVSQIACGCPTKAPSGCLKYYTEPTGTVQSFNYGTTENSELSSQLSTGTRELANQNYGVCVAMVPGYCSIEWKQSQTNSFTVSGDTEANSEIIGTPEASVGGENCTTDFVIIPHPYVNGMALNYDRFCGNALPTVTSFTKPFVLYVVNNRNESEGIANRGFSLDYTQRRCSSVTTINNANGNF